MSTLVIEDELMFFDRSILTAVSFLPMDRLNH